MSAMDWEAPIPVWIESLSIDEDMSDASQRGSFHDAAYTPLVTKSLSITVSPTSPTDHTMFGSEIDDDACTDERDSICVKFGVEDITPIVESLAVKSAAMFPAPWPAKSVAMTTTPSTGAVGKSAAPAISPVKSKLAAKPHSARARASADPIGRDQRRKNKQRTYEKTYRTRRKQTRAQCEQEWIKLEQLVRRLLSRRTAAVGRQDEANVPLRQAYKELLLEERALREAEAFDGCFISWMQALDLYGGDAASNRDLRAQINALPGLPTCHLFHLTW